MAEEKKKMKRRSYLDDYKKNAAGEYEYTGRYVAFVGTEAERRGLVIRLIALCAAGFAAGVICGCIPAAGMDNCFYVLLPYAAALCACFRTLWAAGRLAVHKEPLKEYVHAATVKRIVPWAWVWAVTAAMSAVSSAVFAVLHDGGIQVASSIAFWVLELGSAAAAVWMTRSVKKAEWKVNNA